MTQGVREGLGLGMQAQVEASCCFVPPPDVRRVFSHERCPQAAITTLFLAHPSPSLLLPHLPAPAADAPCLSDMRWHDVKVQLLRPLLLPCSLHSG